MQKPKDVILERISPSTSEIPETNTNSSGSSTTSDPMKMLMSMSSDTSASSYNKQAPSKPTPFSSITAEHLKYLGVAVKCFSKLPQEASSSFKPTKDVQEATKKYGASMREVQKVLNDDTHGNHALVTYTFLEDAAKLSTLRHPSFHFSVCTDKRYNDHNEVGPIKNMKTGNALIFQGTLPNLITRFEGTPDDSPHAFDAAELSAKYYQSFVLRTMRGCMHERLPEAIAHALALSHVSERDQVYFALTDGQDWLFALLRQDSDTGGWTTLTSSRHDMEWVDFDVSDDASSDDGIELRPRLALIMDLLMRWIDGTDNEAHESDPGGKDILSFLPADESRKTPIPPEAINFSSVTFENIGDLGVEIRPFNQPPRPKAHTVSEEEIQVTDELFDQLRRAHRFYVGEATGLPSTALSLFLVSLARVLAIRIPSRRLGITSNKIYDGAYKTFGIDDNLIPFKNVKTGEKVILQGPGNNVVFEYENKPQNRSRGYIPFRGEFLPNYHPSFIFEASRGPSAKLSESFPQAIAQGMTISRCSGRDRIYFCVTDFQRWVFFLLCRSVEDEDRWTAFHSEEHDTAWIPGEDGGQPNPHLRFVLKLLLEWVDGPVNDLPTLDADLDEKAYAILQR